MRNVVLMTLAACLLLAGAAFAADEGRFERDVRADRLTGRSFFGGCGEETTVVVIDS